MQVTRKRIFVAALWTGCLALGQVPDLLIPGSVMERQIAAEQVHLYRMDVHEGDFVHIKASQLGSDITIRLIRPDGNRFATVDRLQYEGFEDLPWIADASGAI